MTGTMHVHICIRRTNYHALVKRSLVSATQEVSGFYIILINSKMIKSFFDGAAPLSGSQPSLPTAHHFFKKELRL